MCGDVREHCVRSNVVPFTMRDAKDPVPAIVVPEFVHEIVGACRRGGNDLAANAIQK